jgi:aspartate aminotransferase
MAPLDALIAAAAVMLNTGEIRYTPADGIVPEIKKAVIRYTDEHYDRPVTLENIIVSSGAKQAFMVALHAILDPQDEVIFPAPYWVSYPEMVKLAGGVPVPVTATDGYVPVPSRRSSCRRRLLHQGHHAQQPEQPERRDVPTSFIADVVEFCERKHIWLIMDDTTTGWSSTAAPTNVYEFARRDVGIEPRRSS